MDVARDYGSSHKIDCNSAIAVIGLLGLIEILRDLVDQVVGLRKKRSLNVFQDIQYAAMNFAKTQLPNEMSNILPGVILPFMHSLADINDGLLPSSCLELSFCQANFALVDQQSEQFQNNTLKSNLKFQVSKYLSEVLAKSFVLDATAYDSALRAGSIGRTGEKNCERMFGHSCNLKESHKPNLKFDMSHLNFLGKNTCS